MVDGAAAEKYAATGCPHTHRYPAGVKGAARIARYAWAAPTTAVGLVLLLLALASGGRARSVRGVLEVHGGVASWLLVRLRASAMTLGHVVLGLDERAHDLSREHERVHVRQCERWGPLFLPAYGAASLVSWIRGQHYYFDNRFEREAYALDVARRAAKGPACGDRPEG